MLGYKWKSTCHGLKQTKTRDEQNVGCVVAKHSTFHTWERRHLPLTSHAKGSKQSAATSEASATPITTARATATPSSTSLSSATKQASITDSVTKNEVLTAEVMWALKVANSHYSFESSEDASLLFRRMFPDSQIATQLGQSMPNVQIKKNLPTRPSQIWLKKFKDVHTLLNRCSQKY